jgi:2-polyprenyl-3-methyl-5-hydroxy-6-metoxy-1,4-benzoquinol methylase
MITSGLNIPDTVNDNIYYDRSNTQTNTQSLRDFHNRYVKRKLIVNVSKRGDTLLDMSVGMGGDLQKWIDAKLSFVMGIDYSKDNIHNRIKGTCARYLRMKKWRSLH